MGAISFEWILGAVFVGFNAYGRYNTPSSNRETTTFQHFSLYFFLYLLSVLILYVVFGALFDSSPETISIFFTGKLPTNDGAALPEQLTGLSAPLISALFLSTLLPSIPWLSKYEKALLQFFWDKGHIPNHVYRMAAIMRRAPFNFSPQQKKELRRFCDSIELDFESLDVLNGASLDHRWARINVLLAGIEPWEESDTGRLRRFMLDYREELAQLLAARDEINREFVELRTEQVEPQALAKMERFLDRSITELFRSSTVFVARAVCISELTESGRSFRISQLGFESGGQRDDKLSPRQLAEAVLCILLTFFMISVLQELSKDAQYRKYGNVTFMTFLMVFTYGASLIVALQIKAGVHGGYNGLTRQRPLFAYLWIVLATGASWLFVSVAYRYIPGMLKGESSELNLSQVLTDISWSYPYALQSIALALAISIILDVHESGQVTERLSVKRRLVDVALAATLLAIASIFTYCWMEGIGPFEGYATRDEIFRGKTSFWWLVFKGTAVGAVVGWLVPTWFSINRTKVPEKAVARLIAMNRKGLAEEIRCLEPDELVKAVAGIAAAVAAVDEVVSRTETDVYLIICSDLAGIPNSDIDTHLAEEEFKTALVLQENQESDLEHRLATIRQLPLLRALMPYIAASIAMANGVYLSQERALVDTIQQLLQPNSD
ncbi:hypothetical protein [Parahaliea mediterranea]|uniref:Uncharacterized protein n=1 Tax=Parahaliea mediterranea TaxID=651086 RepID=A0A939DHZ5_9GAMM|nr:hypothetical protein [Parahaliea mediterranea]MBN7797817.1 hypothetical protein [Parahaliea mediterranea]